MTMDERWGERAPGMTNADPLRLLDALPTGAALIDRAGGLLACNAALGDLLGAAPAAGCTLDTLLAGLREPPGHAERDRGEIIAYRRAHILSGGALTFLQAAPSGALLSITTRPAGDAIALIVEDVTEAREEGEVLARSAHQARELLDSSPVAVAIIGAGGRFLFANAQHDRLYGASFDDSPRDVRDVYVDPGQRDRLMAEYRSKGELRNAEVHLKRPDGSTFWALLSWEKMEYDGEPALVSWIYDITDRKAAEAALEAAREAAERANQTKSEFLANMSHELRTPLNAIIGYAQILQEDAEDEGQDAMLADLRKIEGAGKHLLGLINDILDLSKIEAGRMETYIEPVSIPRLVDELQSLATPLATSNGNTLELTVDPSLDLLHTDFTKVKQSLLNLLSNACKFTKQGVVRLAVAPVADGVSFTVRDSGIGMNDEQLSRLFQPFSQADSSTTREFGGTGLGLAITRRLCRMLGGDVSVVSAPGEGSIFTITLPLEPPAPVSRVTQAAAPADRGPEDAATILLVDDDPQVHELIGTMLSREGYRVAHAANGADAIERARELRPAAVLLDLMMPQVDGWSVLAALKKDSELAEIPVVIVSLLDERPLGLSLGAAEFLTKPVDRARLVSTVRSIAGAARGRVLVVDDDPLSRGQIAQSLAASGHDVIEAASGVEALAWLADHPPPALMILDLLMPQMDGFTVLDRVRRDERLGDLRVVVVTAKDLTPQERDFLTGRGSVVLTKGAAPGTELLAMLRGQDNQVEA
jgi:PAS domain S-box-containing protein